MSVPLQPPSTGADALNIGAYDTASDLLATYLLTHNDPAWTVKLTKQHPEGQFLYPFTQHDIHATVDACAVADSVGQCVLCRRLVMRRYKMDTPYFEANTMMTNGLVCHSCFVARQFGHRASDTNLLRSIAVWRDGLDIDGWFPWDVSHHGWWELPQHRPLAASFIAKSWTRRQYWARVDASYDPHWLTLFVDVDAPKLGIPAGSVSVPTAVQADVAAAVDTFIRTWIPRTARKEGFRALDTWMATELLPLLKSDTITGGDRLVLSEVTRYQITCRITIAKKPTAS